MGKSGWVFVAFVVGNAAALLSSAAELNALVDQVNPEMTSYLSKEQLGKFFVGFGKSLNSNESIYQMAIDVYSIAVTVMTKEQQQEAWASIVKAKESYGGFDKMQVIVFHCLDAINSFLGGSVAKDRSDFKAAEKSGQSAEEVSALVYSRLREYWNVEFGQKVLDVVKRAMTVEDWKIATIDAAQYMNVAAFNMNY